jgi:hypothetical protein
MNKIKKNKWVGIKLIFLTFYFLSKLFKLKNHNLLINLNFKKVLIN